MYTNAHSEKTKIKVSNSNIIEFLDLVVIFSCRVYKIELDEQLIMFNIQINALGIVFLASIVLQIEPFCFKF